MFTHTVSYENICFALNGIGAWPSVHVNSVAFAPKEKFVGSFCHLLGFIGWLFKFTLVAKLAQLRVYE
jgi:predicted small integral membrane protein